MSRTSSDYIRAFSETSETSEEIEELKSQNSSEIENDDETQIKQLLKLKIGTHNSWFHADEVLAVRMLKFLESEKDVEIIRTRDQKILDECDIVVDVGQVYNPEKNRYDHHQSSCTETFDESSKIPLSSAGLVYKHFGQVFIQKFFEEQLDEEFRNKVKGTTDPYYDSFKKEYLDLVYREFYYRFIREIDANDNGVSQIKTEYSRPEIYNYPVFLVHGVTISKLNSDNPSNDKEQMTQFKKAMQITWWLLNIHLKSIFQYQYSYIVDRVKVRKYYTNRPHPAIIVLEENTSTWRQHLKELDTKNEVKFSIYPRKPDNSEWGFSTMQKSGQRFVNEINLMEEEKLKEFLTYPQDLIFVHKNLFCGSTTKLHSAIEVCILSYEQNRPRLTEQLQDILKSQWITQATIAVTVVGTMWLFDRYFSIVRK